MLGEALDAEALRYVTGRYFDTMRAAVASEGTVEKFMAMLSWPCSEYRESGRRRISGRSVPPPICKPPDHTER